MTTRRNIIIAGVSVTIAGFAIDVQAGADKVAFPESYANGVVYMTIDRANNKQLTEYYVSQDAIEAAKKACRYRTAQG